MLAATFALLTLSAQAETDESAMALYRALVERHRQAKGIELSCEGKWVEGDRPDGEVILQAGFDVEICLPYSGRLTTTNPRRAEPHEVLGDGRAFYTLNRADRTCEPYRGDMMDYLSVILDLPFLEVMEGDQFREPTAVESLEADAAHEGLQGIRLVYPRRFVDLWMQQDGSLRSVTCISESEPDQDSPAGRHTRSRCDFAYSRYRLRTDAEPSTLAVSLPEGFKVLPDIVDNEGLLAVGTPAPDVRFTDLDGKEFRLTELRGKTVLLNFWFFH